MTTPKNDPELRVIRAAVLQRAREAGVKTEIPDPELETVLVEAIDIIREELPERHYIVGPWLPEQGLAMIYAPRGLGKTYLAISIACAVSSGQSLLGWEVPEPKSVLYLDGEMPLATLRDRLIKIGMDPRYPPSARFSFLTPDKQPQSMPDLSTDRGQELVDYHIEAGGYHLIIIDNLSTLCRAGDENEGLAWVIVQDWALKHRAKGRSILFVHHAGKNGGQRGTSRREDVLDTVISLRRPQDYAPTDGARFEIHYEKARTFAGAEASALDCKLQTNCDGLVWAYRPLSISLEQRVMELDAEGLPQRSIAAEVGMSLGWVNKVIRKHKPYSRP